jgi:hypothetical protein
MAHHEAPQNNSSNQCEEDGSADALAAVAVIAVVVATVSFWLAGMA